MECSVLLVPVAFRMTHRAGGGLALTAFWSNILRLFHTPMILRGYYRHTICGAHIGSFLSGPGLTGFMITPHQTVALTILQAIEQFCGFAGFFAHSGYAPGVLFRPRARLPGSPPFLPWRKHYALAHTGASVASFGETSGFA